MYSKLAELTKRLYEHGIMLTTGSDFPNPWVIPGLALPQEMALLAQCGIPNLAIIKMATLNGTKALGIDAEIGSIERGKTATFLILNNNPRI